MQEKGKENLQTAHLAKVNSEGKFSFALKTEFEIC